MGRLAWLLAVQRAAIWRGYVTGPAQAVERVFPDLSVLSARHVAGVIDSHLPVIRAFQRLAASGRTPELAEGRWLFEAIRLDDTGAGASLTAPGPRIAVSWHGGFVYGVTAALARVGVGGILLRFAPGPAVRIHGFEQVAVGATPASRARAFARARRTLDAGGTVAIIAGLSPRLEVDVPVSFLGRRCAMARGAAALSRLTGAPLVPYMSRLHLDGVHVHSRPAIPAADDDRTTVRRIAAVFEAIVRHSPSDLWPNNLDLLARSPLDVDAVRHEVDSGGRPRHRPPV